MKNTQSNGSPSGIKKTAPHLSKFLILFSFLLIAFTVGNGRSEYVVPAGSIYVFSSDFDLDEDNDIVVGSNYCPQTQWGGAFMNNTGNGYFQLTDSLKVEYGVFNILGDFFDNNSFIDIYTRLQTTDPYTENILIIYNFGDTKFDNIKQFYLYNGAPINGYSNGDINNNNSEDIVFICNNDFLWGIIYNDGTGNFSSPEYFTLDFPPTDIECADLNDDGRSDIVVTGGSKTEIYFSTETGFNQQLLTETLNLYVLISDFDNDNDNDIILHTTYYANHHRVYMFENLGYNEFYEHPYFEFTPFCSYAQIADFNNDSLPDMVFIADNHSGLYMYENIGSFQLGFDQFIPHQRTNPQGLFCEDYDNNGFIDIAFTSGVGGIDYYLNILFNDGHGNFQQNPIQDIQTINLTSGYQFSSTSIKMENKNMLDVLEPILNENIDFVRNSNGETLRKIGPNWINGIGNWVTTEAYLFKMNGNETLTLKGQAIDVATPIPVLCTMMIVEFYMSEIQLIS
ncbi:MAG: VCBS repeat-containing protein [Bacteroidales bacterium]|nr:VCBS repeat-containing protein [Bacteroidales bacterium]